MACLHVCTSYTLSLSKIRIKKIAIIGATYKYIQFLNLSRIITNHHKCVPSNKSPRSILKYNLVKYDAACIIYKFLPNKNFARSLYLKVLRTE